MPTPRRGWRRPMTLLKALERMRYGRRFEALDRDQHAFVLEEVETGFAAVNAGLDAANPDRARAPTAQDTAAPFAAVRGRDRAGCGTLRLRLARAGRDWRERVGASRRRSGKVPRGRHPPAEMCLVSSKPAMMSAIIARTSCCRVRVVTPVADQAATRSAASMPASRARSPRPASCPPTRP